MDAVSPTSALGRTRVTIAALALGVVGAGAYGIHERNVAHEASNQNAQIATSLKSTNAQVEQLTAKFNELSAPKPVVERPARPAATRVHQTATTRRVRGADGRWREIQTRLDAQGKEIQSTKEDLANTRTELQGSIARTHDEVVVLQKKGERDYFEFDLDKSKQFAHQGPFGIKLKKANTKKQYADLELIVDDVTLQKKHVNLYEPAVFYSADSDHPVELVINRISKDHIKGYVSAPHYRRSELTASSDATNSPADSSKTPKPRQRLQVPN
jgi:hypothetical protein